MSTYHDRRAELRELRRQREAADLNSRTRSLTTR